MKVQVCETVEINISLTLKEARWLNAAMQNPIGGGSPDYEPAEESEMRRKFYEATAGLDATSLLQRLAKNGTPSA